MDQSQLAQVEELANTLYTSINTAQRNEAQHQLLLLKSSIDFIPQCQFILENSTNNFAKLIASSSLESLVTQFWNNFTNNQKVDLLNFCMNYLANNGPNLDDFVLNSLTKLNSRIIKLGWQELNENREVVSGILRFLEVTIDHQIIGFKMLISLVEEINTPIQGKSNTYHRKIAVSFRDHSLFLIFQTTFNKLYSVIESASATSNSLNNLNPKESKFVQLCLTLIYNCLSFDFIGSNPDDSSDDIGTIQVPTSWRSIVQDYKTLELFFNIYNMSQSSLNKICLEILIQLSSIRRSIFNSEIDRKNFLQTLINNIYNIMETKNGLNVEDNYHEFCRLLGRLKASYQLVELISLNNFTGWLELASDFTIQSLKNWRYSMNSIHYLLALWGRLVAALPYLRPDNAEYSRVTQVLKQCVINIMENYIKYMLESVEVIVLSDGDVEEDPLEDEGGLKEQMDRLPVLARLQYELIARDIISLLEFNLASYEKFLNEINQQFNFPAVSFNNSLFNLANSQFSTVNSSQFGNIQLSPTQEKQKEVFEGKLTWLIYITASIIDPQANNTEAKKIQQDLIWDGHLCKLVFQIIFLLHVELINTNGLIRGNERIELAILYFFRVFKRVHFTDLNTAVSFAASNPSTIIPASSGTSTGAALYIPGGSTPHHLLNLAFKPNEEKDLLASATSATTPEVATIYDAMRLGQGGENMFQLMNIIINKLCNNIKYFSANSHNNNSEKLLEETLSLFIELILSYSSNKSLLSLNSIQFLIHNHTGNYFPFLAYDNNNKLRINFYSALTRLVFSTSEDLNNSFDQFIQPNISLLDQLSSLNEINNSEAEVAIIGILRDLRGISQATYNKRTYNLLFDLLYPTYFPLFNKISQVYYNNPTVIIALFKFLLEFVTNKSQRISFELSSANGILLFREISTILCVYGSQILQIPVQNNIYKEKYKGIRLFFDILTAILSGNYVNYGVFALYNDNSLQNILDISLQICLSIPLHDIMNYIKLNKSYYFFLEVLYKNHLDLLSSLDSSVFLKLLETVLEGLQHSDTFINSSCANIIDSIATYLFLNHNKDKKRTYYNLKMHFNSSSVISSSFLSSSSSLSSTLNSNASSEAASIENKLKNNLLFNIINILFNSLLFNNSNWIITRPILPILLTFEDSFKEYQAYFLSSQPIENHEKIREEFVRLTSDVSRSVEVSNRDKFTQRLNNFRLNIRSLISL